MDLLDMESSRDKNIQRRRLQNRLAQRRFRQKHSQQKAAQQPPENQEDNGRRRNSSGAPYPPDISPGGDPPSPSDLFAAGFDDAPDAAFSPSGASIHHDKIGFCRLGYGGNIMLESITGLELELNSIGSSGTTHPATPASMSVVPSSLSSAETAAEHTVYSAFHTTSRPSASTTQGQGDGGLGTSMDDLPSLQESVPGNKWQSPLHMAARKGHNRIVCVLLQHNIDCNEKDSEGLTPLIHATIGGFEDVVSSLLAHGARLGSLDSQHRSALHWAVVHRREALLKLLLKHSVRVGERSVIDGYDTHGKTPLHTAIDTGFEAGVQVLLQYGANVHFKAGVP